MIWHIPFAHIFSLKSSLTSHGTSPSIRFDCHPSSDRRHNQWMTFVIVFVAKFRLRRIKIRALNRTALLQCERHSFEPLLLWNRKFTRKFQWPSIVTHSHPQSPKITTRAYVACYMGSTFGFTNGVVSERLRLAKGRSWAHVHRYVPKWSGSATNYKSEIEPLGVARVLANKSFNFG